MKGFKEGFNVDTKSFRSNLVSGVYLHVTIV